MKAQVNLGHELSDVLGKEVRYNDSVMGTVTSYDQETGMATIDIKNDYYAILTASQQVGVSSRGIKK